MKGKKNKEYHESDDDLIDTPIFTEIESNAKPDNCENISNLTRSESGQSIHNNTDWINVDNQIKSIKYPFIFLINIIKYQRCIDDYLLSILIRFYFKNLFELCFEYPLFIIFNRLDSKFEITKKVVNDFYLGLSKKFYLLKTIGEFKSICDKTSWYEEVFSKNLIEQKIKLEEIHQFFKAHFDASKTGMDGVMRLINQIKSSFNIYEYEKNPIIIEIKSRFKRLDYFFGDKIFKEKKIIIVSEEEFDKIGNEDKIKYVLYFFLKIDKFFSKIIHNYDIFIIESQKLKEIINPRPIIINLDSIVSESETDDYDLLI